tara:strand:+ start:11064 stop:11285 length:222 start_codon:yes stop_codon:yes gene_type:complete
MSKKQVEINNAVHNMVSFIKETVTNNLASGLHSGLFQVEDVELRKIAALVSDSIDQGFIRSHGDLEAVVKNIQ